MYKYTLQYIALTCILVVSSAFHPTYLENSKRIEFNAFDENQQNIPQAIARKLKRDAARLALRIESEREDLRYMNVQIPQDRLNGIYNLLAAVYTNGEAGKSIEKCNVHTFPNPSIDHLVLIFDKNVSWAAPLRNGITETDNKTINKLLNSYDLVIEKYVQWNEKQDAVTIRSKDALNMAALAAEFESIEGVTEVDLGLPKVSGNDIRMKRIATGWQIDFVLKFGAYAEGGGKEHIWRYNADDKGNVSFSTETGEPIPAWMKCEMMELAKRL